MPAFPQGESGYRDRPILKKPIRYEELAAVFACLLSRPSGALEA
jgi:hypothetical protein